MNGFRGSSSDDGSSSSGSSGSFLLPYGVFDVVRGVERNVGRSKANPAEADLAVELYRQLRPALVVKEAARAAEAAGRQEMLLTAPSDVSGVGVGELGCRGAGVCVGGGGRRVRGLLCSVVCWTAGQ